MACAWRWRRGRYRIGLTPPEIETTLLRHAAALGTECWIARDSAGKSRARLSGSVSAQDKSVGYLGFFEVDLGSGAGPQAVAALLDAGYAWLTERGVRRVIAPAFLNIWFPFRLRVDDHSEHFAWEPNNPPEYVGQLRAAGFVPAQTYHSHGLDASELLDATRAEFNRAGKNGFEFRDIEGGNGFKRDLSLIHTLTLAGFEGSDLFEPIDFESFRAAYVAQLQGVDTRLSRFVLDGSGSEVGFLLAFPDNGYTVLKTVAVTPAARGQGLSNALVHGAVRDGLACGLKRAITALVRVGAQSESYARKARVLWRHEYLLLGRAL